MESGIVGRARAREEIPKHGRRTFAEDDATTLVVLCRSLIKKGKFGQKDIINTLEQTREGRQFMEKMEEYLGPNWKKKLYDRLRVEVRRKSKE